MDKLIMLIATGLGLGYLPKAPGTWGSLLGIPIHLLLIQLATKNYVIALVVIVVVGVLAAGSAEKIMDRRDPGLVVIDEVIGMLITLIGAPAKPLVLLMGFILFRIFDIAKPYPIRLIDRHLNGGIGIVMDDMLAGVFALAVLQVICRLAGWC